MRPITGFLRKGKDARKKEGRKLLKKVPMCSRTAKGRRKGSGGIIRWTYDKKERGGKGGGRKEGPPVVPSITKDKSQKRKKEKVGRDFSFAKKKGIEGGRTRGEEEKKKVVLCA